MKDLPLSPDFRTLSSPFMWRSWPPVLAQISHRTDKLPISTPSVESRGECLRICEDTYDEIHAQCIRMPVHKREAMSNRCQLLWHGAYARNHVRYVCHICQQNCQYMSVQLYTHKGKCVNTPFRAYARIHVRTIMIDSSDCITFVNVWDGWNFPQLMETFMP